MMGTTADVQDDEIDPMLGEAMDWLLKLQSVPGDPALRAELEAWLAADAAHAAAWERINRAWSHIGLHRPLHPEQWAVGTPAAGAATSSRRASWRGPLWHGAVATGVAALAACLILLIVPALMLRLEADHLTAVGETRKVILADGTTVHMAPDSAITADFSPHRRAVVLLQGQAFFEVVRDEDRPFTVDAGEVETTVVGTAFDVQLASASVTVGLQVGQVKVRYDHGSDLLEERLTPGERLVVDRTTGQATRHAVPPQEVALWRDGRLFVDGARISEVVEQLRRYQPGWIVIADGHLGAQPVTGLYDLKSPIRALAALVEPYGGTVREVTPYLHVISGR